MVGRHGRLDQHRTCEDHEPLLAEIMARDPTWDWNDFLAGSKKAATYDGKLCGIPYRITTGIMHYQKALLEQAGITKLPEDLGRVAEGRIALNTAARSLRLRHVRAARGRRSISGFSPWLYSSGGGMLDFKTGEIFINNAKAVEALEFWSTSSPRTRSCRPRR